MAQLKNYPLIAQITILTDNNPHFKKKGKTFSSLHRYIKPYHTTNHLQKKGERTTKYPISNKLVTTQIPK